MKILIISDIEKIEIVMSDVLDYEVIKMHGWYDLISERKVPQGQGVKWVYDNVLNLCVDYKPEVFVVDVKTRVLKYRL